MFYRMAARSTTWMAAAGLLCSAAALAQYAPRDDSGRRVPLPAPPQRIVSLAPGATEMLFAAGAGARVVATVDYSDEPAAARRLARIGDSQAIDLERLIALRPDLVVVWPGGNHPAQIERVERLGVPIYRHSVQRLGDLPASLLRFGELAGTRATAQAAADDLRERLAALEERYAGRPHLTVLLEVWNRPIYTVGGSHLMSDALRLCGMRNVFADLSELGPVVEIEAIAARDPDVIVAVAARGTAAGWLTEWSRLPGLSAVRHGRLIAFEDSRLSRLGPSALAATEALCQAMDAVRP
jgi:iron complex transport system substrate-binding protein